MVQNRHRHNNIAIWHIWHNLIFLFLFISPVPVPVFMHALRLVSLNWKLPRVAFLPHILWLPECEMSVTAEQKGLLGLGSAKPLRNNPGLKDVKRNHHNNNSSPAFIIVIHMNDTHSSRTWGRERKYEIYFVYAYLHLSVKRAVHFQRGWNF